MTEINPAGSLPVVGTTTTGKAATFKAAAASVRTHGTNVLDALAPAFAPFAQRWDAEATRRKSLRTPENLKRLIEAQRAHTSARSTAATAKAQRSAARKATSNPLAAERRAARTADRAAARHKREARAALKAARREYPATLARRAVELHAAHAVPAAVASWALSTPADWTVWPASLSASLIGVNAAALWLGRRSPAVVVDDGLSAEERALVERLDPSYWVQHATERGLDGTVTTPPEVTSGGIRCDVRLDGKWTVKRFAAEVDSIRALLGARTALRIRVTSGTRGGWAVITLSTRSATEGTSSLWTPEMIPADPGLMSLGLDTETGEPVLIPFDERLLISGASGTGKSWSTRPLMAHAQIHGDLVLIDGKGEEANVWSPVCRTAVEPHEIDAVIDELHEEMTDRKHELKRTGQSVWTGRQITAVVDEGQVVLAHVKRDRDRLQRLIELSSLGRSRGVVLWWATQYPVTDGGAPGVHQLIAPNLLTRFSLRVAGTVQAGVALDDCAHYAPHQIPEGKEWRGHGYLKGYGPRMIRTWTLDDAGVRALPANVWKGPDGPRGLSLVKLDGDRQEVTAVPAAEVETNRARVLRAVRNGAASNAEIVKATGINKGTVSREVKALEKSGEIVRDTEGRITLGGAA